MRKLVVVPAQVGETVEIIWQNASGSEVLAECHTAPPPDTWKARIAMALKQVPSVGRIVHFRYGITDHAAIVTHVWADDLVNLTVFPDTVLEASCPLTPTSVVYCEPETAKGFSWHWPERIESASSQQQEQSER